MSNTHNLPEGVQSQLEDIPLVSNPSSVSDLRVLRYGNFSSTQLRLVPLDLQIRCGAVSAIPERGVWVYNYGANEVTPIGRAKNSMPRCLWNVFPVIGVYDCTKAKHLSELVEDTARFASEAYSEKDWQRKYECKRYFGMVEQPWGG